MPRVSVIVPARDAAATLPALLAGLAAQEGAGEFEVVVVDNGSLDATAEIAEDSSVVSRVLRRARGEGPGAARNAGAVAGSAPRLAFLDADCVPAPGWLAEGARALEHLDLVQGRVLPAEVPLAPFDRTLSLGGHRGLFESANLFVRREWFVRAGGFPPGLERSGAPFGEDVIFGWRAVRAGARAGFCPRALARHAVVSRSWREHVAERRRLALFPALAAEVPELRRVFFPGGLFHSRRSAAFDLALAGAGGALAGRRGALALTLPYLALAVREAAPWGRRRLPAVLAAGLAADAVGAVALARGSLAARTLLI